jgi:hypothetical protein
MLGVAWRCNTLLSSPLPSLYICLPYPICPLSIPILSYPIIIIYQLLYLLLYYANVVSVYPPSVARPITAEAAGRSLVAKLTSARLRPLRDPTLICTKEMTAAKPA